MTLRLASVSADRADVSPMAELPKRASRKAKHDWLQLTAEGLTLRTGTTFPVIRTTDKQGYNNRNIVI